VVTGWCGNSSQVPEIAFPLVKTVILAASIKEEDVRIAIDQPATIETFYALYTHRVESAGDMRIGWFLCLHLHGSRFVRERADESVPVTKLGDGDWYFGFYDGVDTADLVCDLPSAFEEDWVTDIALIVSH
jgi:hypothetical protein